MKAYEMKTDRGENQASAVIALVKQHGSSMATVG